MADIAAAAERARQAWNRGDLPGYLSLYDDSIRLHGYAPEPMDKAAVRAFYEAVTTALGEGAHGPPRLVFHEVMTDGDLYCCRFTMTGTHRGPFMGIPATGKLIRSAASRSCFFPASASWNAGHRPTCSG